MNGLAEFLLARIAEDEADVQKGMLRVSGPASAYHILADCEAKRRIVEMHRGWHLCPDGREVDATVGGSIDERQCPTLALLALPYADHPEFNEEWKV